MPIRQLILLLPLAVAALLFLQSKWPLRQQHFSVLRRLLRNFVLATPSFAASRLALIPLPFFVSNWATTQRFGVFHWFNVPQPLALVAGLLIYDYAYFWWHQLMHLAPVCWRFHNVHHTDLDMDITTASRFHFGEVAMSIPFRCAIVASFGLGIWTLAIYEVLFALATQFHHSNWRLPIQMERLLNYVVVTPRMHGTHHSIVQRETNSNWGTVSSCWDRMHRTLRIDIPQAEITIGVAAYRDEGELTAGKLFLLPFQRQREWRLPNGEYPQRAEHATKSRAP
jgi:sterol desaturase/sphingolipid hydroxylase (fatty acid hydroxylase superfamily)